MHLDAIQGKLRAKRRGRGGLDFEDSDSDDEDEHAKRLRQRAAKKRRIDGDSLEELARNNETLAFVQAYNHDDDDADDFSHIQQDDATLVDEIEPRETETHEVVSVEQVIREGRERGWDNVESFDPDDITWAEQDSETEETFTVKELAPASKAKRSGSGMAWTATEGLDDSTTTTSTERSHEAERARLAQWAKTERVASRHGGHGRSTGASAVTGHGRAKAGAGSHNQHNSSTGSDLAKRPTKVAKASSILSAVASRRGKFGS